MAKNRCIQFPERTTLSSWSLQRENSFNSKLLMLADSHLPFPPFTHTMWSLSTTLFAYNRIRTAQHTRARHEASHYDHISQALDMIYVLRITAGVVSEDKPNLRAFAGKLAENKFYKRTARCLLSLITGMNLLVNFCTYVYYTARVLILLRYVL